MRFTLSPVSAVDGEAVLPLADAKAHLRVDHDDEDDLIGSLRDAAVDSVQQYTGHQLTEQAFVWRGRFCDSIDLGIGPVTAIVGITYYDSDGAVQTATHATLARIGIHNRVQLRAGQSWPVTENSDDAATISFTAGHDDTTRPPALVQAVRLMLGNLYMNRETVVTGAGGLPAGFVALCSPYRKVML